MSRKNLVVFSILAVASGCLVGCGRSADEADTVASAPTAAAETGHVHGEWWCSEHGVPEEVCALCDASLIPDFKAKGDWCDEHDRPDSQCFLCHPEKEAEFAAQYEAKYGEKPPKPADAGQAHEHQEHDATP